MPFLLLYDGFENLQNGDKRVLLIAVEDGFQHRECVGKFYGAVLIEVHGIEVFADGAVCNRIGFFAVNGGCKVARKRHNGNGNLAVHAVRIHSLLGLCRIRPDVMSAVCDFGVDNGGTAQSEVI